MTFSTKRLTESVTLHSLTTKKFKTGMLALSVSMPKEKYTSAYNYLLSGVLRRGTKSYPSMAALNRRLDELFAATIEIKSVRHARHESFTVLAELLDNAFSDDGTDIADGVLSVMSELLTLPLRDKNGLFSEDTLEKEKKIAVDNLESIINNPRGYAALRAAEIMNRDEKDFLDLRSTIDETKSVTSKMMTEYYEKNILSRNIDLFYVGSLTEDEIAGRILTHFDEHRATAITPAPSLEPKLVSREAVYLSEPMPVSQGKLVMGFRTGITAKTPDYYAMLLLSEIYGGSPISKLFMNVRERMSLCYYCSSAYNMYTGTLSVSSGIEVSDEKKTTDAILSELDAIKSGDFSDTELDAAKKSLINSYRQMLDNPFDLHSFYSARVAFGIDASIDGCCKKISSLTREDVLRVARDIELDTTYFLLGTKAGEEDGYDE